MSLTIYKNTYPIDNGINIMDVIFKTWTVTPSELPVLGLARRRLGAGRLSARGGGAQGFGAQGGGGDDLEKRGRSRSIDRYRYINK